MWLLFENPEVHIIMDLLGKLFSQGEDGQHFRVGASNVAVCAPCILQAVNQRVHLVHNVADSVHGRVEHLGGNSAGFFWPKIWLPYWPKKRPKTPFEKDICI